MKTLATIFALAAGIWAITDESYFAGALAIFAAILFASSSKDKAND